MKGVNLFQNLIAQQEELIQNSIDELNHAEDELNQMLEMLKNYEDINPDVEQPPWVTQVIFNSGTGGFV